MRSLLALVFLLICTSIALCAQTVEEYTARRIAAITVPPPPRPVSASGMKTYVYWHTAALEVGVCMDQAAIRKDHFWTAGKVGPLITHDLRVLPQRGVDPDAVNAVLQIADVFDQMRQIAHAMTDAGAKLGIKLAGGESGGLQEGKSVLSGPDKVLAMLRERDEYNRKLIALLQRRYGVPFQELQLENVSPAVGMWLGYDGVCGAG
jgi:hypothetical protein